MRCLEIMKRYVECLSEHETVHMAARKMRDAAVGFLPVCDRFGRAIGVLTDRDLVLRVLAENRPRSMRVVEVMTTALIACRPDDEIERAEALMAHYHIGRVLVTDEDGELAGVISRSDLSGAAAGAGALTFADLSDLHAH